MQYQIILSALAAVAFAAPAPAADCDPAPAPTTPLVQKCLWDVNGVTQLMSAGDSLTVNGKDVACGTTSHEIFGVFAKCKLQPSQKAGSCDTVKDEANIIKCVYKASGVPNYGTCR